MQVLKQMIFHIWSMLIAVKRRPVEYFIVFGRRWLAIAIRVCNFPKCPVTTGKFNFGASAQKVRQSVLHFCSIGRLLRMSVLHFCLLHLFENDKEDLLQQNCKTCTVQMGSFSCRDHGKMNLEVRAAHISTLIYFWASVESSSSIITEQSNTEKYKKYRNEFGGACRAYLDPHLFLSFCWAERAGLGSGIITGQLNTEGLASAVTWRLFSNL